MEGLSAEAASLAGHLGLARLIVLYDDNGISIEGSTDIAFTEDVKQRFEAYHWHVQTVEDGNDLRAIAATLDAAQQENQRPSLIMLKTQIAYGSPNKAGTADAHGAPLGEEEVCLTKKCLGCAEDETFCVPDNVRARFRQALDKGGDAEAAWQGLMDAYRTRHPEQAATLQRVLDGDMAEDWDAKVPDFKPDDGPLATRAASGMVLNALAAKIDTLIGGSADLAPSNKTFLNDIAEFQKNSYEGRNIRFGVREHAMAAIMSGMALHGGLKPYGGTFLVFADYMRPSVRLAALMGLPVIYVFTHDSIAVGEDGPTHQPVEHLASLRAIPGLTVIRPADATETADAWRVAVSSTDRPVALALTRQKLAVLDREALSPTQSLTKGAYVLVDTEGQPDIILMATGSEVHLVLAACKQLANKGIKARVVSMPSWELFEAMPASYREEVLPAGVTARLAVEMGILMGWERYVGDGGDIVGMKGFGASAPGPVVQEKFGFTVENVVRRALEILNR